MTVLVTGGAGYIGSHTVRALRRQGEGVVVLDTLETGRAEAVGDATLVVGDVTDREVVAKLLTDHAVDVVVHFAGYKNPGESMLDPGRYFENNVTGSLRLLEAVRDEGVDKVVFSSSCSVYGTPATLPVSEDAALHPESPYGESKLMVERLLGWYDIALNVRSVSLRYFNAAGAAEDASIGEDWSATHNLVPLVMKAVLGRRPPVQVFGTDYPTPDGTAVRDYIHVDDLADAHVRAVEYLRAGGTTTALNLSTGTGSSVQEVINTVEAVSGRTVPREYVHRRPGDPAFIYGTNQRARDVLGWSPRWGLQEIISSAWRWHATQVDEGRES